jgi:twinkle protein
MLGQVAIDLLEERRISPETASDFGIYTGRMQGDDDDRRVVPDLYGNIIVFPFMEHGVAVNEKYRAPGKRFWQRKGGRKTFWNADVLDDPALIAEHAEKLYITEGEFDALSAIECGFKRTVSVPDGAPPPPRDGQHTPQPFDPEAERTGKFEFIWNNRERLRKIKRFVLAVDNDPAGQALANELLRRLGTGRCMFVTYPEGCKDLNAVHMRLGKEAVVAVLHGARPYPVQGLYRLSEYPAITTPKVISTGWESLSSFRPINQENPNSNDTGVAGQLYLFPGELFVVTGIPSHGKSTWVLNLLVNIARIYGWPSAIFSPEMPAVPYLRDKLVKIIGADALKFIEDYFTFIDNDPNGDVAENTTLSWVLEKATDAVLRDGARILVIDPWNEIEHARAKDESLTEYVGRALRMLKRFARQHDLIMIVVAHPTKDVFEHGKYRTPSLYDIEGSAHWFNKCDHGVVIERPDPTKDETVIHISKVRFDGTGEKGHVRMVFVRATSRYTMLGGDEASRPAQLEMIR